MLFKPEIKFGIDLSVYSMFIIVVKLRRKLVPIIRHNSTIYKGHSSTEYCSHRYSTLFCFRRFSTCIRAPALFFALKDCQPIEKRLQC